MKDEYSLEAEVYDKIWGKYDYDIDIRFLDKLFKKNKSKKVIDIGCGTGNHAIRLSKLGYEITGVDVSSTMLEKARGKTKEAKVRFIHGDMRKLNEIISQDEKFDAAICLGSVSFHLITNEDVQTFLKGLYKILKENGLFICDARNAKKISEDHLNKLTVEHVINEKKNQLLVLAYSTRSKEDRNVIAWRPIFLMNDNGKIDFQIREHKFKWADFSNWRKLLIANGFELLSTQSGPTEEEFDEERHEAMWFVARTLKVLKHQHKQDVLAENL